MIPPQNLKTGMLCIIVVMLTTGCDDRVTQVAREAADRQAQQNTAMANLNNQVASGSRALVESDAKARVEIVGVHRDLQAERSRLETAWNDLESDRRAIAGARRTESFLAPAAEILGSVLVVVVLLGFLWRVLVGLEAGETPDLALGELLIDELLAGPPLSVPSPSRLADLSRPLEPLSLRD